MLRHPGLHGDVAGGLESHGTRSVIRVFPLILREIVRWFYGPERNPCDAQSWMTCRPASHLHYLAKEEVRFCKKDSGGRSHVDSLMDVDGDRRTDNLYRKYPGDVYGAVSQAG